MNDASGSNWREWDLHFHTPKSYDYGNKRLSPQQAIERLKQKLFNLLKITPKATPCSQ